MLNRKVIKSFVNYNMNVDCILKGDTYMRNFGFGNNSDFDNNNLEFNDNDGFNINNNNNLNSTNNQDVNFLADLLSSDNTEILLFIIVFLLLFTSFGRR